MTLYNRQPRRIENRLYEFVEGCLRDYHTNIRDLRSRIEYLEAISEKSPSAFDDKGQVQGNAETCPLQRTIETIDDDAEVARLRKRTEPITYFLTLLDPNDYEFISIPYGGSQIASEKCLSPYRFMPSMQSSL
jgi:hypothetical protein